MTIRRGNTIVAGIASTVVLDNVTTSMNANDAVQSIGTINKNGSSSDIAVYNWVGTLAQYTAQQIETQHPDWICYITDDGEASVSPWCLFDFKYTDYVLSNPNWVNADANEWCTSTNYPNAYAHLVADLTGISSSTETIGSYTITFYRATDGHKICLADQAQTIDNIFAETGVAWYYLVDTANSRFKLPRRTNRILVEKKEPTDNDSTWYNLYSDGWCEQGGTIQNTQGSATQLNQAFLKNFTNIPNVQITLETTYTGGAYYAAHSGVNSVTVSGFNYYSGMAGLSKTFWQASGYTTTIVLQYLEMYLN